MLDDAHRLIWERLGQAFGTAPGQRELLPRTDFHDGLICDCCGRPATDWVAPFAFLHESYGQDLINCPSCRIFTSQQPDALCWDRQSRGGTKIAMKLQSVAGGMLIVPPPPAPVSMMLGGKYLERTWGQACQIVPITGNAQLAYLLDTPPPPGSVVVALSLRVERYTRHIRLSSGEGFTIADDTGAIDVPTANWPAFRDSLLAMTSPQRQKARSLAARMLSGALNPSSPDMAEAIDKQPNLADFFASLPVDPFAARIYLNAATAATAGAAQ